MPQWLAVAHEWLPFGYMAQAMRQTLDTPPGGVPLLPFAVLSGCYRGGRWSVWS